MWCSAVGSFVTLILSLLVASIAAGAQQATKVHRIGWLNAGVKSGWNATERRCESWYVDEH